MTNKTLSGKVIAVTGASQGIGYQTALQLAAKGAHIIAIARTVSRLEELDDAIRELGGSSTIVPMDLSDFAAIDRLGGVINQRWQKLDGLVANGAILGPLSPLGHVSTKEWDNVIAVNVTANWRLIRSFDALLRNAEFAKVVFLSSGTAWKCMPFWGPYSVSKAAVEALAKTYATECKETEMVINAFNPGPTRTAMRAQAMPGEDPETLPTSSEVAVEIVNLMQPSFMQSGMIFNFTTKKLFPLLSGYPS